MGVDKKSVAVGIAAVAAALVAGAYILRDVGTPTRAAAESVSAPVSARPPAAANSVELTDAQLREVKIEPIGIHEFPVEKGAVGSIDFNEDMAVQVFTPYQGRIADLFAKVADEVHQGQTLFTIDSPDLVQASSTLIAAAGVLELTSKNLARLRGLYETRAVAQKDLEQAISDQQSAEGALRAARDAIRLFGKSDADIDRIIAQRRVDRYLVVPSPISGRVTARNAAPGLLVQPGNAPAPYTVADISTMWMIANVAEADSPQFHVGQEVTVSVLAFPGRVFSGKITTIASTVDPNTRRVLVRSEITDPQHELRSGMFATFVIRTGAPLRSPAIALNGVVREGDGSMTIWVTADRRHFTERRVKIGVEHDGYRQILEGAQSGELAATDGALFLSNAVATASRGSAD